VPFTKSPEISIFVSEQFWGRAARASRLERVRTPVKFSPAFSRRAIQKILGKKKPLTVEPTKNSRKDRKEEKVHVIFLASFAV
jgi:hypothetical protein